MRYAKVLLVAGILLVGEGLPVQVSAQDMGIRSGKFINVDQSVGLIKNIVLLVEDKVSGGCWTNVDQVKEQVRRSLEESGLQVYDEPLLILSPLSSNLVITVDGSRSSEGICFGNIQMASYRSVLTLFEGAQIQYQGVNFSQNTAAYHRKSLNAPFLKAVDAHTAAFTASIMTNRKVPGVAATLAKWADKEEHLIPVRVLANIFNSTQRDSPE